MEKYELRYLIKSELKREWLPTREALVERLQQLAQTEKRILGTWKVSEKNGILTSESLDIQVFGKCVVIK